MIYLISFLFAYFFVGAYVAGIATVFCDDDGCSSRETLKYVVVFIFLWLPLILRELFLYRAAKPACCPYNCK